MTVGTGPMHQSITVQWFDETPSTNDLAKSALQNQTDLVAFAARVQTKGRGRVQRTWQSLDGNLHLSLALPAHLISHLKLDGLTIRVGRHVAEWIEKQYQLRVHVKWPNDLVGFGCKFGGILCESIFEGQDLKGVCIGVGLDLNVAPNSLDLEQEAISLLQLTGKRLAARKACDELANFLIGRLLGTEFVEERNVSLPSKRFWQHLDSGQWYREVSDDDKVEDGRPLTLMDHHGVATAIVSGDHRFRWEFAAKQQMVVCDVGNSNTKWAVFERRGLELISVQQWSASNQKIVDELAVPELEETTRFCVQRKIPLLMHCVSVHGAVQLKFEALLEKCSWQLSTCGKNPVYNVQSHYDLTKIGADRFASLERVLMVKAAGVFGSAVMVISFGTATTVDFISESGEHLGGLIGSSRHGIKQSLHQQTAQLPAVADRDHASLFSQHIPAQTTDDAIEAASQRQVASWIDREIHEFAKRRDMETKNLTVVVTGGDWQRIKPLLGTDADLRTMENLVLEGVCVLSLFGR
jgi:biotin-[acetyl-CoA-carboxylase] ligase BirA-like protein